MKPREINHNIIKRSLRVIVALVRRTFLSTLEHRGDFIVNFFGILMEVASYVVLIEVIFNQVNSVAGYSKGELLLLYGFFTTLRLFFMSLFAHGLKEIPGLVVRGELDHFLVKPVHPLLLLSFHQVNLRKLPAVFAGLIIIAYAFSQLAIEISTGPVFAVIGVMFAAFLFFYGLLLTIYVMSFFFGEIGHAFYVFNEFLQLARYPVSAFKGVFALIFVFVIPLGLFGALPTAVLLERVSPGVVLSVCVIAFVWFAFSIWFWRFAVSRYASGGG